MDTADELIARIDSWRQDILDFASLLVATPSVNPPGDERAVAALAAQRMRDLGLADVETVAEVPERPNLLGRVPGTTGKPRLILNGHLDTKPVGDRSQWRTDPLVPTVKDGNLYGLGSADMKGAVAAMIYAAGALARLPRPPAGELLLTLTADEEAGSRYGAQFLVEKHGIHADACLIGEPSGLREQWEHLVLVSRGICAFRTRIRGTQMHASVSNIVPCVNASTKMAEVMVRMGRELRVSYSPHPLLPQGPTINIGMRVESGVFYGILPAHAEFTSDVRVQPGMTFERVKADVEGFVERLRQEDPELDIEVEFEEPPLRWIEPTELSPVEPIVWAAQDAARRVLGRTVPFGACPGWTDARWFQGAAGIPTIPAFGPGLLPLCHGPNEYVPVEGIIQAAKVYALTAAQFLTSPT